MTRHADRGAALLLALMAVLLLTALGLALMLTTTTETMIANSFSLGVEGLYAADAGTDRAIEDLQALGDWTTVLSGQATSAFSDGPGTGDRLTPAGAMLSLARLVAMANCGKPAGCTSADMDAITAERPWGPNNPRWRVFASGPFDNIAQTGTVNSLFYVVVMVADDPSEADSDPATDSNGVIVLRTEAFGPGESHRGIEVTVARADGAGGAHGYLGQQGADGPAARRPAVQSPGKTLGASGFSTEPRS